jgi:LuxR family transcriptional regulator, maltose regulon positive regulatory protein
MGPRSTSVHATAAGTLSAGDIVVLDARIDGPPLRLAGTVRRKALLRQLRPAKVAPVVTILAPAGYGKSTVSAQWAGVTPSSFTWVTVDERDNDPAVLLYAVASALDRVEPVEPLIFDALTTSRLDVTAVVVPLLTRWFASRAGSSVLLLDDVHILTNPDSIGAVDMLAARIPKGTTLALVGRSWPGMSIARMRAMGGLLEIGPEDLSMDEDEAASLVRGAGIDLPKKEIAALTTHTEGWPVGLYLSTLSRKGGSSGQLMAPSSDHDRFVADYLWSEFFSALPKRDMRFLERVSVLDRMNGPLCDAVLGAQRSSRTLEMLSEHPMLIPLDRHRDWYRCNPLFRDALLHRLGRRDPDLVTALRLRAADWYQRNGMAEDAIRYAMLAGAVDQVARLVAGIALPLYASGRATTLQKWLDWLDGNGGIDRYPPAAVIGAWFRALTGHPADAQRWAEAAERRSFDETMPDGTDSIDAWLALLRAAMCQRGVEQMELDAAIASDGLAAGSQWRAMAGLLVGLSRWLGGDPLGADESLEDAVELSEHFGMLPVVSLAVAERSLLAIERGDWEEAATQARLARSVIREARAEEYPASIVAYTAQARLSAHAGDVDGALKHLASANRLRPLLTYAFPHLAIQVRLELARTYVALADVGAARMLLREAGDVLRRRPRLGILSEQIEALRAQLSAIQGGRSGASTLTSAELRLLPQLPTYLSFREIGEQLHLSPHTVKTQAISIYRKLGVTSRGQAIERARELGLLTP